MAPPAPEPHRLVLDKASAVRVWNWILTRQGLSDSRRLSTAREVADAALGLHAARLPSPYAIVAARTGSATVPASLFTESVRAELITLRCMRKTLHALPLPLAAAAHAATLRFRERDALRAIRNAGYSPQAVTGFADRLCDLLADGPLPYRAIESLLAGHQCEVAAARLAVKITWERGGVAYINGSSAWNRESRTFALTASAYPALDLSLDRGEAETALITAYFQRYGPATIRDAAWWSGLSATSIGTALARSGRELVTVATPWTAEACLMFADQAAEALGSQEATGVQFLAHEDTALKAYQQTRARYLADVPRHRAFNRIGEALPAIILDGHVIGAWSWDGRSRSVRTRLVPGKTTPPVRHQVRARAACLTETLRAAWTSADASPNQRNTAIRPPTGPLSARVTT